MNFKDGLFIVSVAVVGTALNVGLQHIPDQRACPQPDVTATLLATRQCPKCTAYPEQRRWWEEPEVCWIAQLMLSNRNLEKLHAFLGQQLKEVGRCDPNKADCMDTWLRMRAKVDRYLKKMVKDHGGPLIDRNWSK